MEIYPHVVLYGAKDLERGGVSLEWEFRKKGTDLQEETHGVPGSTMIRAAAIFGVRGPQLLHVLAS